MRKYLLPQTGNFYKTNLHCHSTFSDGNLTPEQIKEAYVSHGYSAVAFTDHRVLIGHNELSDDRFIALNGIELDFPESKDTPEVVNGERDQYTCHICLIARDSDNLVQPCYHRTKYLSQKQEEAGLRAYLKFDESKPDFEKTYSVECINAAIAEARENGFFITYNHPTWSLETYGAYTGYRGYHAMEMANYSSCQIGYDDYNPKIYDDILRTGNRIGCVASDDNHNKHPFESSFCDSFGGFTMIKAEKLGYKDLTDALVDGNYYASQGPEIYELYYEDGYIHVKCSNARKISMQTLTRHNRRVIAERGESLNEAKLKFLPEYRSARITVEDAEGKHANTRAYFLDELCD